MTGTTFNPLSDEELNAIHAGALEILESVGVELKDCDAFETFERRGAETTGTVVKIPASMVADALESAPSHVVLRGRDPKHDLELEGRRVHLGTGGAALQVIDVDAREPRKACLQDIARLARLVDDLEHIDFYLRPVVAQDVPQASLDVNKFYASLLHTSKHVMGSAYSISSYRDVRTLGSIIAGSMESLKQKPFLSFITCWTRSPLTFHPPTTHVMMEIVKDALPVVLSSAPMAGTTAPVTLAGTLVQLHAEILSGLVLTQLLNPGAPVICGYVPSVANPLTMDYLGGAAEFGLLNAAAVQLAGHLGLPNYSSAGLTEAKVPDQQAGIEKALSVLQVAMAGGNYIHHAAGMLESMLTVSYAQYVIDNDLLGMVKRILKGISVNDDTLCRELIATVGYSGSYLGQKHTAKNLRREYFFPRCMDRQSRKDWMQEGSPDLWQRASDMARAILADSRPPLIPESLDREIRGRYEILL